MRYGTPTREDGERPPWSLKSEEVLQKQGPNTRHPDALSFTNPGRVEGLEEVIRWYLLETVSYADAGIKPPNRMIGAGVGRAASCWP